MGKRDYSSGVKAGLQSLCARRCYWPDCTEPVVRFIDGKPVNNLQIAHISAAESDGPRYVEGMTEEERKSFSNLVLLCHPHHTLVDKIEPHKYSIKLLQKWKAERESPEIAALQGLRDLTEERLQEIITEAVTARDERIEAALKRFEEVDFESAKALREMIDELNQLRTYGAILDPDVVATLYSATAELKPHLNYDTVEWLSSAASTLSRLSLPDSAEALIDAADALSSVPDLVTQLQSVVNQLRSAQGNM